jgi:prephenate dehydrogenase
MFVELLLDAGADVCIIDARRPEPAASRCAFECSDITVIESRLEVELRRADLVVLAIPEQAALAAVAGVARALRPGALLADTLSVKSRIVAALGAHAGHLEVLGLNPMFAPSLGMDGRTVAAVISQDGPRVQQLLALLHERGGQVVTLDAQRHDELTSVTQALTHAAVLAFGIALLELDVDVCDIGELATPPHLTLLALLARIASGQPETYWDVQAANPHAPRARAALADAVRRLADVIDDGNEADFADIVARLRRGLGRDLPTHGELCEHIFSTLRHR